MTTAVQPEKILKELQALWVDLGKQNSGEAAAGVLRACSMTLIVVTDGPADADDVGETLGLLMRENPSRAIVLRIVDGGEPKIEARVFAQCWMPFGRRQQICCEQIEVNATVSRLADAYSAMLGLTVPDLPVILWLRSAKLLMSGDCENVLPIARTIIIDSSTMPDAEGVLKRVASQRAAGWRIKDLAWARITRWRETVSQVFEDPRARASVKDIAEIAIGHSGVTPPAKARYMAAWLSARLPKATCSFVPEQESFAGGMQSVTLRGGGFEASLKRVEADTVEVRVGAMASRVIFPDLSDHELLREELSILGRDPTFEQVLKLVEKAA